MILSYIAGPSFPGCSCISLKVWLLLDFCHRVNKSRWRGDTGHISSAENKANWILRWKTVSVFCCRHAGLRTLRTISFTFLQRSGGQRTDETKNKMQVRNETQRKEMHAITPGNLLVGLHYHLLLSAKDCKRFCHCYCIHSTLWDLFLFFP